MRLFHAILLTILCATTRAQHVVHVKDADTRLPLSFATAECLQQQWGTYTDSAGRVTIPEKVYNTCKVLFSFTGYTPLQVQLSSAGNTVYLHRAARTMDEVFLKTCNSRKTQKIKQRVRHHNLTLSFRTDSASRALGGYMWASFVTNPYNRRSKVKEISFGVHNFWGQKTCNAPVRIHFYELDTASNLPGDEIGLETIELVPGKFGWITRDISNYNLYIPADGVVVAFEMYYAGPQHNYSGTYKDAKLGVTPYSGYGWSLETAPHPKGCYQKRPGSNWFNWRSGLNKFGDAPAVGLTVEVCND